MNYNFDATPAAQAQQDFVPLLIGADMNAYSVARALHEQYGVVSHALGRFAAGDTKYSRITSVKDGATFEWIATAENGWHAIVVNAQVGWVSGKYSQVV